MLQVFTAKSKTDVGYRHDALDLCGLFSSITLNLQYTRDALESSIRQCLRIKYIRTKEVHNAWNVPCGQDGLWQPTWSRLNPAYSRRIDTVIDSTS